jgi:hypothetical protein
VWANDTPPELSWMFVFPPTNTSPPQESSSVTGPELLWISRFPAIVVSQIVTGPDEPAISTFPLICAFEIAQALFTLTFPFTGPLKAPEQFTFPPAATGAVAATTAVQTMAAGTRSHALRIRLSSLV